MIKRIVIGVVLFVVLSFSTGLIVLGVVNVSNRPELNSPDSISLTFTNGKGFNVHKDDPDENDVATYNRLMKAYEEMFDLSLLRGIFTGKLKTAEIKESLTKPVINGNKVTFNYLENQVLTKDGEEYYSKYDIKKKFEYRTVEFIISEYDAYNDIAIVISLVDTVNNKSFYAEIVTMANTNKMYKVIDDYYKT